MLGLKRDIMVNWLFNMKYDFFLEEGRRIRAMSMISLSYNYIGVVLCAPGNHDQLNASPNFRTVFGLAASTNLLGIFEDPDLLIASRPVLPWEYVDFGGHEKGKKDSTQVGYGVKQA